MYASRGPPGRHDAVHQAMILCIFIIIAWAIYTIWAEHTQSQQRRLWGL